MSGSSAPTAGYGPHRAHGSPRRARPRRLDRPPEDAGAPDGRRERSCVPGALLSLATLWGGTDAHAQDMFAVRDQNPLIRGFYLPLPADSGAGAPAHAEAMLLVSNTLNVEKRADESLLVDGESTVLDLSLDQGFAPGWRYRLSLPVIHDGGGVLDGAIEDWHRFFGFSQGYRPYYPRNQLDYYYSGAEGRIVADRTGVGDLAADIGWYAVDRDSLSLSIWGGFAAPTGSHRDFMGDGAWNGALWTHASLGLGRWRIVAELGLTQPFGDEIFAGRAHVTTGFARLAVSRELGSRWTLRAQLDAQTRRVDDTELRFLGPSLQLSVGADARLIGRWRLQLGFTEDAAVNTAPDITFFIGLRR